MNRNGEVSLMSKQTDEKRLKVNLLFKILVTVFIPLIILVAFCIASINKVGSDMSNKLTQGELENLTYTIQSQLNSLNDGELTYDGTVLSKGDYSLTENTQLLDDFKANTGVDVTLIWGNKRVATTITDGSGNRVVNTTISDTAYDSIKTNHTYFDNNVDVQGEAFYGYYELINDQGDGNEFIIFTGKDSASVHSIYMKVLRFNIILMLGIAFLIVVLISIVVGKIAKSIDKSVECLDRVAEGELNIQIDEKLLGRGDEVGNIARAIQDLMDKFKGLVLNKVPKK